MKYLIKIISLCILGISFATCDDMYSIHQKYLDEGEQVYLGKPNIVVVQGGLERIQLIWKLTADPKIEKCCIYWNDREDSLEVPPNYTDTVMRQIIPLKEGNYVFEMKTKGKNNLYSLTSTSSGKSYGDEYIALLANRILKSQKIDKDGILNIEWGTEDNCVGLELEYTNNSGQKKEASLLGAETVLKLSDFVPGSEFTYRSLYLPTKTALDTIPAKDAVAKFILN